MAVTITVSDVREVIKSSLPDAVIVGLIAHMDRADQCLDANMVDDDSQRNLKLFAVAHLLQLQDLGAYASETAPTGASQTYRTTGNDLTNTGWGKIVSALDLFGCIRSNLAPTGSRLFFKAVG